jgi:hypothetical protein
MVRIVQGGEINPALALCGLDFAYVGEKYTEVERTREQE